MKLTNSSLDTDSNGSSTKKLIGEIVEMARMGMLPDGDGINVSTAIWAESWWSRINPAEYEAWLKGK